MARMHVCWRFPSLSKRPLAHAEMTSIDTRRLQRRTPKTGRVGHTYKLIYIRLLVIDDNNMEA